jgi:UDP-N-acetylmuramoyl-tripeptide--D-alanyl-D-alanine ligase
MGMNHAGEIAELCRIAQPNIVAVNNVGRAHIEHFGSVDGIAKAKEEIYHDLPNTSRAAFNLADERTADMYARLKENFSRTITFGTPQSDVHLQLLSSEPGGLKIHCRLFNYEQTVMVPLFGTQNVSNLMTACSLALLAETKEEVIFSQLEKCETGWGRNQWVVLQSGAQALFDGYNANPDSFAALIRNLPSVAKPGQKMIGVFSEMRELGDLAASEHFELGKQIALSPVTECYFMGASQVHFKAGFESVNNGKYLYISDIYEESLALKIKSMLNNKTLVVIKGSRGGALERVLVGLDPKNFTTK